MKEAGQASKPVVARIRNDVQMEELTPVCLADMALKKQLLAIIDNKLTEIGTTIDAAHSNKDQQTV